MSPLTSKNQLNIISIVYFAVIGTMFFGVLVASILISFEIVIPESPGLVQIFLYTNLGLAVVGTVLAFIVFKNLISKVDSNESLRAKIARYMGAMLIREACFEIPGFFGVVCVFKTGDFTFFAFTTLMAGLMFYFRPTIESIAASLQLSDSERAILENPDGMIE